MWFWTKTISGDITSQCRKSDVKVGCYSFLLVGYITLTSQLDCVRYNMSAFKTMLFSLVTQYARQSTWLLIRVSLVQVQLGEWRSLHSFECRLFSCLKVWRNQENTKTREQIHFCSLVFWLIVTKTRVFVCETCELKNIRNYIIL